MRCQQWKVPLWKSFAATLDTIWPRPRSFYFDMRVFGQARYMAHPVVLGQNCPLGREGDLWCLKHTIPLINLPPNNYCHSTLCGSLIHNNNSTFKFRISWKIPQPPLWMIHCGSDSSYPGLGTNYSRLILVTCICYSCPSLLFMYNFSLQSIWYPYFTCIYFKVFILETYKIRAFRRTLGVIHLYFV